MNERFLHFYNRELQFLRKSGGEFAREFPKIAGRLGLDEFACADPYVERLLEGFAFLAARVQLKIDAEFPRFTQSMLETLYPHYLAPAPSMAVVQFQPDFKQKAIDKGYVLPRGTVLRSQVGKGESTPCKYLTAQEVALRPLEIAEAAYHSRTFGKLDVPREVGGKAAIQLTLRCSKGRKLQDLDLDEVVLFLRGGEAAMRVYEQFFAQCCGVVVRPGSGAARTQAVLDPGSISRVGFGDDEAILPYPPRAFSGYRLLQEYFTLPDRFMFVRISGLSEVTARCAADTLNIITVTREVDATLENAVDASMFALHCAPAVNLFPHRTDRVNITERHSEVQVVPDRTRPLDFEVCFITKVTGHGEGGETDFRPFYSATDLDAASEEGRGFYVANRMPRPASARVRERGPRSSYVGSEVFLSLVDLKAAPYPEELKQLSIEALCSNRDLPLQMPVGQGKTDFLLEVAAPVTEVRCVSGPTPPRPSFAEGETSWRLVNHLSLNYLSLVNTEQGAQRLRDLLRLYGNLASPEVRKQIDGLVEVSSRPIMRRVATEGAIAFARGLEISLTFDEASFEGTGVFALGAVLERFFAKYVSINSFTETRVNTLKRGEIMRWRPQMGKRHIL